jgi:hypothetical protein
MGRKMNDTINFSKEQKTVISIDWTYLYNLYEKKDFYTLSEKLIEVLNHFRENTYIEISENLQNFIDIFMENLFIFFIKEDYFFDDRHINTFLLHNSTISNLAAISKFKNTDQALATIKDQKNNFLKILTLYSARNNIRFDSGLFFDLHPHHASLWYAVSFYSTETLLTQTVYENMKEHLVSIDSRFLLYGNAASGGFFVSTYIDEDKDRLYKQRVNELMKAELKGIEIRNRPVKNKIAIATALWHPTTAVYKTCFDFINSLKNDYDLTLIHMGNQDDDIDKSIFSDVRYVHTVGDHLNLDQIADNDFMLIYYTDVGMNYPSRYMSNLRIAPIQAAGCGHPVSTFGSEIDYFFSGKDSEVLEEAENNYSERLVLIPGVGLHPVIPMYEMKNIQKTRDDFIISCSWGANKFNYPMMLNLKKIIERSQKKLLFRFFPSWMLLRDNKFLVFNIEATSILGKDNFEVIPDSKFDMYLSMLEEGDISIDSYHFGGFNTAVDSLYVKKPFVAYEGKKAYNRFASRLLRILGLEELITSNDEEYINLIVKLIQDDQYRDNVTAKIRKLNLKEKILNAERPETFKKAIDHLISNHEVLKAEGSKKPIIIE